MKFLTVTLFILVSLTVIDAARPRKPKRPHKPRKRCDPVKICRRDSARQSYCVEDFQGNHILLRHSCIFNVLRCEHPRMGYTKVNLHLCQAHMHATDPCKIVCPTRKDPVCGHDVYGEPHLYDNECYLEVEQCKYPEKHWNAVKLEECNERNEFATTVMVDEIIEFSTVPVTDWTEENIDEFTLPTPYPSEETTDDSSDLPVTDSTDVMTSGTEASDSEPEALDLSDLMRSKKRTNH